MDNLPWGTFRAHLNGSPYIVTKTRFSGGRSTKLVAEELGGADYISFNYYALSRGGRLFPCEMSRDKVIWFVLNVRPETTRHHAEA
ncbi:hypothetical protein KX928_22380 [Roseobacter sp. YSTF-M11]|uniref:Uncharacterized protein n=1 Tax=Roseobacter insulae TaxID=2859783 RepID=A0A9X1FZF0_9RHOB|nr:hypothetical protein [Roseobacter insulae]